MRIKCKSPLRVSDVVHAPPFSGRKATTVLFEPGKYYEYEPALGVKLGVPLYKVYISGNDCWYLMQHHIDTWFYSCEDERDLKINLIL
jgi:hypothetical protein